MIPAIVVSVLLISLIESLFVLPAHLGHQKKRTPRGIVAWLSSKQQRVSKGMVWTAQSLYRPFLRTALSYRYTTIAIALACFMACIGYIAGGHIGFSFMPRVESDYITAQATLPFGAPMERSRHVQALLVEAANQVLKENGEEDISRGIFTLIGKPMIHGGPVSMNRSVPGSHDVAVRVFLVSSDKRKISSAKFTKEWRKKVGDLPGLDSLRFAYSIGPSAGSPIDIQLSHPDTATLEKAARELATMVSSYAGVKDVDPGVASGKSQIDFNLRPEAKGMGLSSIDVGVQLRSAFFGAEALRQQRKRNELRVMVRLPAEERRSEYDVESLILRTPTGGEIPLSEAVDIRRGQAYTFIRRDTGRRVLDVTADIVEGQTTAGKVLRTLKMDGLKKLMQTYPGLQYSFEGERRQQSESMDSLKRGFMLALLVIFGLLAIPFRSYAQPLVVMSAIPFGVIGALIGHIFMGFDLSIISMMGIVALAGVVVNDSLVLVHAANRAREDCSTATDAMLVAGVRRFRPIILTSLTTFFGLAPMIFESSVQARFLIPMAISLGFGVLFATFIILLLVPALYVILDDVQSMFGVKRSVSDDSQDFEDNPVEAEPT
ncbi:MAG: hypothetical protein CMH54_04380 [Myxococcales bacterium]|nr:hypothetical protein [Myxococcales bacterium]